MNLLKRFTCILMAASVLATFSHSLVSAAGASTSTAQIPQIAICPTPTPVIVSYQHFNVVFKTDNADHQQFTEADAANLRRLLLQKADKYSCDEQNMQFISLQYDQNQQLSANKDMVADLLQMGYVVLNLQCENSKAVFSIAKRGNTMVVQPATDKVAQAVVQRSIDCSDCGAVKLSDELINKFKDADFGGEVIQFDLDSDLSGEEQNP